MKAHEDKQKYMPAISVKHLSKSFTYYKKEEGLKGSLKALFFREMLTKQAVKDISFDIEPGEFVGFVGPNGAGKTTTLKILSGILSPTDGEIRVLGHNPQKREDAFKKKISIVMGQKSQLWIMLPPIETFNLIQKMYDIPERTYRSRLKELTELLDVTEIIHVQARKLSLGQRMKCELIASLLHDPKILFLDEPTIGLDILSQKIIRDFLQKYNREKKTTIILTSHYMEDIKNLCERIIVINEGSLILDDSLDHVVDKYSTHKIIKTTFEEKVFKKDLAVIGNVISYSPFEAQIRIPSDQNREKIQLLFSKFPVKDLTVADITLEEIVGDIFNGKNK